MALRCRVLDWGVGFKVQGFWNRTLDPELISTVSTASKVTTISGGQMLMNKEQRSRKSTLRP